MAKLGTEKLYFHTPEAHTNQQYIPKHPITFNPCPIEPKFAHFEAISILHTMPPQRRSQGLAAPPTDPPAPLKKPRTSNSKGNTMASNARFGLYWARIEGVWGYIAGLYVPQVCENKVSPCRALPRILHLPIAKKAPTRASPRTSRLDREVGLVNSTFSSTSAYSRSAYVLYG